MPINRRDWLRQSSLAALTLGFSLPSMGNEEGITRRFGVENGMLNLGSNENPYGMSPKAREALMAMIGEHNRYQFNVRALDNFRGELGAHYGIGDEHIIVTAGSGDALSRLARHFSKGKLVTATPTFATLPNSAKKIGTKVTEVPLNADKVHDLQGMLRAIDHETQLVYVCNPANPSSTVLAPAELRSFCAEASRKATVVIDEAYIDFLNAPYNESMIPLVHDNPNIIVLRTFSKIHAMAGLRIGFIAAHPATITKLDEGNFSGTQMMVSNLTMAAALASLGDDAHRENSRQQNAAVRTYTTEALRQLGFRPVPSNTNFIFFPLGNYAGNFSENMLRKKVLLRSDNFADGKWARVSLGTMDEMKQFMTIMKG